MLKAMLKMMVKQQMKRKIRFDGYRVQVNRTTQAGFAQWEGLRRQAGFTLIELMVAVIIVAILTAVAIGSYQYFADKKDLAIAQQEVQNIAAELEKFKAKNFSYKGFDASYLYGTAYDSTTGELNLPIDASENEQKYTISLLDLETSNPLTTAYGTDGSETTTSEAVLGLNWLITATRKASGGAVIQPNNYDLLLTSTGLRCQSRTNNAFDAFDATAHSECSDIDSNSEVW